MRVCYLLGILAVACVSPTQAAAPPVSESLSFFDYLRGQKPTPAMVAYSPTGYDPRPKKRQVPSADSIKDDLTALRPAFDGLILYGYDKDITPVILAEAQRQRFRAVLLGVWDPRSAEERAGVVPLIRKYRKDLALALCLGNEGICFNRYRLAHLTEAAVQFRKELGKEAADIPLTTSEPFAEYAQVEVRRFGDFLAINCHPVFDTDPNRTRPADAASWVKERAMALAETARKPILVKETGWPHGGGKPYSAQAQQQFWRAYTQDKSLLTSKKRPEAWVSHAAAFEAFDLPWKAEESRKAIEGCWGLLDVHRKPREAFAVWRDLHQPAKK